MAARGKRTSLNLTCVHEHDFVLDPDIQINSVGAGFQAICPTCGGVAPVKNAAVARLLDLDESSTKAQILVAMGRDPVSSLAVELGKPEESPSGENKDDPEDPDLQNQDENPEGEDPPLLVVKPISRSVQKQRVAMKPMIESAEPEVRTSDEDHILTGQDVFLDIVQTSGLADDTVVFLRQWIAVEGNWDDPRNVREALAKAAVPSAKADLLAKKFESRMELYRKKAAMNEGMAEYMTATLGQRNGPGSVPRYPGSRPGPSVRPGDGLETITINAIVEQARGNLTPDVMAKIDEVRRMHALARGEVSQTTAGGFVSQTVSPASIQQLVAESQKNTLDAVKQLLENKNQEEKRAEEEKLRRAADDKRYNDMMQMMQMVIASKNNAPAQPVESPEKMMLTEVMGILKENMKPQAPPQDPMQHPLVVKMFDHMFDESRGKPSDALVSLSQEIAAVKDTLEHLGGGPRGLPANPEQLHAYVDYLKTMADIDRTKNEFTEKSETRKLISTIAETGLKTVGEAIAATFIVNPGTPQERKVPVAMRPIDDGSVIQFPCPGCGTPISAPVDARAVMCPECKAIMDRAGQQMTQEQLEVLEKEVLAERQASHGELPPAEQPPASPAAPAAPPKKADPASDELGPVSRQMHQPPLQPQKKEEVQAELPQELPVQPEQPPAEESNITPPEQPSQQGG